MVALRHSDEEREALAVRHGDTMLGPLEIGRCEHREPFTFRHVWPVGARPAQSQPVLVDLRCLRCQPQQPSSPAAEGGPGLMRVGERLRSRRAWPGVAAGSEGTVAVVRPGRGGGVDAEIDFGRQILVVDAAADRNAFEVAEPAEVA